MSTAKMRPTAATTAGTIATHSRLFLIAVTRMSCVKIDW